MHYLKKDLDYQSNKIFNKIYPNKDTKNKMYFIHLTKFDLLIIEYYLIVFSILHYYALGIYKQ